MEHISEILNLLNKSYSPYHVISNIEGELKKNKHIELKETNDFALEEGKSYYVKRNDSSLIAFSLPKNSPKGFLFTASHSDSPTFKVKPNPIYKVNNLAMLNVEPYGGAIYYSWLDKPLSIAGRLFVKTKEGLESRLLYIDENLLIIPSLAIHMNREVNKSASFNAAKDMIPMLGISKEGFSFKDYLKAKTGLKEDEEILSFDLSVVNREKALLGGINKEFVYSPRLDDLGSVYTSLLGYLESDPNDYIKVHAVFDNEEVGSLTRQGANSTFLKDIVKRILVKYQNNQTLLPNSFMLSIDNGHANHPNHPEYSDITTKVNLNGGVVIKYNANQKYTTDSYSASYIKLLAEENNLSVQEYSNRSDLPGGSTLGNISNSELSLATADIGLPQLAMHSSYEVTGKNDLEDIISLVKAFYNSSLPYKK